MRGPKAFLAVIIALGFSIGLAIFWMKHSGNILIVPAGLVVAASVAMAYIQLMLFTHNRPQRKSSSGLGGSVEYDSVSVSEALVEVCTPNWKRRMSSVRTDTSGCFEVASNSESTLHYLRISWRHAGTVRLEVEIVPNQPLLHVKLPTKSSWNRSDL
jgi:hypothetical protein